MTSNNAESNQCNEPTYSHQGSTGQPSDQLHEQVETRAVLFETYNAADDTWTSVLIGTTHTEATLRQQYGPVRNVRELIAREDVAEVLDDAC